ncbi:hypothetical protein Tco_0254162 [Tanacetum coccineum]
MSLDHRRLDVFGAWLHRILCHLRFIFHLLRKRRNQRWNLRSIIGNTTSGSDCFQISFRVSNGVARKRTQARSRSGITIYKFGEQPLTHHVPEELEPGKMELGKLVVD